MKFPRWLKFSLQSTGIPSKPDKPESDEDFEVASNIAYRKVSAVLGQFPCNNLSVWLSHNYVEAHWLPIFAEKQSEIDRLRSWAKEIANPTVKRAYSGWINWYDRSLEEARVELRTRNTKTEMDLYESELADMRQQEEKRQATNPLPDPPQLGERI